jgi:hypothetical protein
MDSGVLFASVHSVIAPTSDCWRTVQRIPAGKKKRDEQIVPENPDPEVFRLRIR